jgi:tetratricopeptide (TPR) repeat protein
MKQALLIVLLALVLPSPAAAGASTVTELYQQSFSLETSGDYAGALARMNEVAAEVSTDYLLNLRRGWLLYLNGRYTDSVTAYRDAVALQPRSAEALAGLTLPLMALRQWSDAEKACSDLLAVAPGNYTGMSRLAWVLFSAGRYAEAERAYRGVLVQYPSDNDMRAGLGWSLLRQGKSTDAQEAFKTVLRTVPGHVSAGQGMAALE